MENKNTFNQTKYVNIYNKANYKNIALRVKPADFDLIDNYCNDMHISKQLLLVNAAKYIINNNIPKSEYINDK